MYTVALFNQLAVALSLTTLTGVAIHDTKVDKALVSSIVSSSASKSVASSGDSIKSGEFHTHVERTSFAQAVHEVPRVHVRENNKKHVTPNKVARGHHPFDGFNLPVA